MEYYDGTSLPLGQKKVSLCEMRPHFRGCYVQTSMGSQKVSLLERCPHFRACYIETSLEMGPEDVALLERCPHSGVRGSTVF